MVVDKYTLRRYLLFVVALFVNAFGIAFITKALLGTSPITSVTYVLSMFTPYSMGVWTILFNLMFVLIELPMMTRKELKSDLRMYLLQIPISFCLGVFIDISMFVLSWLHPSGYASQIACLLVGCVILALGIALEVKANIAMLAGEFMVNVISRRFRKDFGYVKLGFDVTLLVLACLLSLIFMSGIKGVREGTVVAALLVGPIVHFVSPYYRIFDKWITPPDKGLAGSAAGAGAGAGTGMGAGIVITIAREFGSGGHLLGEQLSKDLGIPLYDKEFISMAAQRSGIDESYIVKNEQSIPSFWLKCITSNNGEKQLEQSISADDVLFVAESRIVEDLARKGSCIIVGRCADYVLKSWPGLLTVFCYSDREDAVARCINEYGIAADEAEAEIRRVNRNRLLHYEYYTGEKWGDPHRYDLMLNMGCIGIGSASRLVEELYRKRMSEMSASASAPAQSAEVPASAGK